MSLAFTRELVKFVERFDVPVTYEPGFETRGNGQTFDLLGGIMHHTATALASYRPQILVSGRSDLAGPLCNSAGLSNGGLHVVAAFPANHAGASGGPSNGPFPVTGLFNKRVWGHEIVYPGVSPMTDAQYRTAQVLGLAICKILGKNTPEWVRAHRETSITGKWDPGYASGKTIDMAAFRRGLWTLTEDTLASSDEILAQLTRLVNVNERLLERQMGGPLQDPTRGGKPGEKGFDSVDAGKAGGVRHFASATDVLLDVHKESAQRLGRRAPDVVLPESDTVGGHAASAAAISAGNRSSLAELHAKVDNMLAVIEGLPKSSQPAATDVKEVVEGVKALLTSGDIELVGTSGFKPVEA